MATRKPKINPIDAKRIAAARAAELFGQSETLFPSARVGAGALRSGVTGMVQRTLRAVPHLRAQGFMSAPLCKVTFTGEQAYAKHRWEINNVAQTIKVAGALNLPAIAETQTVSRRVADSQCGYALHEAGHFAFTSMNDYGRGIQLIVDTHRVSHDTARAYMNVIEDVTMERALIDAGYAAGFGPLAARLASDSVQRTFESAPGLLDSIRAGGLPALRAFPFVVAFGLRGYAQGMQPCIDALPRKLRALYDECSLRIDALPSRFATFHDTLNGTALAAEVALWLAGEVLAHGAVDQQQQPQPDNGKGDTPAPGEGDAGEAGEAGASDGEAGQGDGAGDDAGDAGEAGQGDSGGNGKGDAADAGEASKGDSGGEGSGEGSGDTPAPDADAPPADTGGQGSNGRGGLGHADQQPVQPIAGDLLAGTIEVSPLPLAEKMVGDDDGFGALMEVASAPVVQRVGTDEVDAAWVHQVEQNAAQVLRAAPLLANDLRVLLDASATDSREGGKRSGKLRTSALTRAACGSDTVFERRTFHDGVDSAVTLLVDQSGSMSSHGANWRSIIIDAQAIAAALGKLLAGVPGVRSEIIGFSSTNASGDDTDAIADGSLMCGDVSAARIVRPAALKIYKGFNDPVGRAFKTLPRMGAHGGTPDISAIVVASRRLLQQSAKRKILMVLTDGESPRHDAVAATLKRVKAQGIIVIGIGIDTPVCEGYEYRATVRSVRDLPKAGLGALFRAVRDDATLRERGEQ